MDFPACKIPMMTWRIVFWGVALHVTCAARHAGRHTPNAAPSTPRAVFARSMADGGSEDDDFASQADRTTTLRQNFAAAIASVLDTNDPNDTRRPLPSAAFAAQLTEVAWQWTTTALAPDLEAFSRHAKRAKISAEDVVLAARKNEQTHAVVEREAAKLKKRPRDG